MGTSNKSLPTVASTCTKTSGLTTPKGNPLYQFTRVSVEERARLRVDVYQYLI